MTKLDKITNWLENEGHAVDEYGQWIVSERTGDYVKAKRPEGLFTVTKNNNSPLDGDGYAVYLYKGEHGLARIAAGCRDFSLEAAEAHWEEVRRHRRDSDQEDQRTNRAGQMVNHVLPKARRMAAKRGMKV